MFQSKDVITATHDTINLYVGFITLPTSLALGALFMPTTVTVTTNKIGVSSMHINSAYDKLINPSANGAPMKTRLGLNLKPRLLAHNTEVLNLGLLKA